MGKIILYSLAYPAAPLRGIKLLYFKLLKTSGGPSVIKNRIAWSSEAGECASGQIHAFPSESDRG
jgi:hypothetical protein